MTPDRHASIAALVTDEELVLDGGEFWIALIVGDGTYLAAWVDEEGRLQRTTRRTATGAIKVASGSWGR